MTATGDHPDVPSDPSGAEGDYSYDLVHDEVPAARRHDLAPDRPHPGPGSDAEADGGGDYSYDLAHEVPPSRPR